jgi:flagellar protein FliJ
VIEINSMARKSSERLQTLLKLVAMREQAAARQLMLSSERLQQAQQQSRQLQQYEHDYQERFVDLGSQPVTRNFLLNYQGFFRQLETAQTQQSHTIELRAGDREQARLRWIEQHAKHRLLSRVREQRLASEALDAEKKTQRELDDRAPKPPHF